MTTHADLVRMAEAATPGAKADPRSFLTSDASVAEYEAAYERHIATWHPARALAALAVIEAAEALSDFLENEKETTDPRELWAEGKDPGAACVACESIEDYEREEQLSTLLDARLAAWNALNDPEGSADDTGPPAPGEGDDLPNPEIGMEC